MIGELINERIVRRSVVFWNILFNPCGYPFAPPRLTSYRFPIFCVRGFIKKTVKYFEIVKIESRLKQKNLSQKTQVFEKHFYKYDYQIILAYASRLRLNPNSVLAKYPIAANARFLTKVAASPPRPAAMAFLIP